MLLWLKKRVMVLGGRLGEMGDMTGLNMPSPLGVPGRVSFVFAMLIWLGFRPAVVLIEPFSLSSEGEELAGKGMFSGAGGGVGSLSGGGISVPSVREPNPPTERAGSSNFEEAGARFLVDIVVVRSCSRVSRV